jgi:hypothetical protein|nr:MAG TPA: hypothetical protein [Caudoviricetes sp.]
MHKEFKDMQWDEFRALLAGISSETALGRVVAIRAENDKNILKNFTPEQHRIRNNWKKRQAQTRTEEDMKNVLDGFKEAFIAMAGGE